MNIRLGDYGFLFQDTIVDENSNIVNLSTATEIYYKFEKPDGTDTSRTGTFSTDGTDGMVEYTVETDLFDTAGVWQYQINVITPARNWNSVITSFFVEDLI